MGMQRINGGHAESSAEGTARRPPSYWYPASRISRINVNALGPAFVPEEFLNERSTLELEHAPGDGEAVIESRLFERAHCRDKRPGFRLACAVDNFANARVHEGADAHETRFDRHVHRRVREPVVAQRTSRFP